MPPYEYYLRETTRQLRGQKQNTWVKIKPCCGRLGNRLFQLASGYGIAASRGARLCITREGVSLLPTLLRGPFPPDCPDAFPQPSFENGYATFQSFPKMHDNIFVGKYLQSWRYFDDIKEDIRKHLRIKEDVKIIAEEYVAHIGALNTVGIHVRKNYEEPYLKFPPKTYFEHAMAHFKGDVQFIVVSDNPTWCASQNVFQRPNVHVITEPHTPALDLAILASCDAVVVTIGTFGWWGGWLSGGEVVYYKDAFVMDHEDNKGKVVEADYYPEGWVGLGDDDDESGRA